MDRNALFKKYPDIFQEIEYQDISYQRYIRHNKLPFAMSWLDEGRRAYLNVEISIWKYLENQIINHTQALKAFMDLMVGYYGFELPDNENFTDVESIDLLELADVNPL